MRQDIRGKKWLVLQKTNTSLPQIKERITVPSSFSWSSSDCSVWGLGCWNGFPSQFYHTKYQSITYAFISKPVACVVKIGLDGYDVEMKGSQDSDLNSNHAFPHCVFPSLLFVQSANVTLLSSGNLLVFAREEFRFLSNNAPLLPFPCCWIPLSFL